MDSTLCQLAVAKLPSSQKTIFGRVSSVSARYCIRLTSAAKKPLRIMPERISASVFSRPCSAGNQINQHQRGEAEEEGTPHHRYDVKTQQDRQRAAEGGAGGHADDMRVDQRVRGTRLVKSRRIAPAQPPANSAIATLGSLTDQTICPAMPLSRRARCASSRKTSARLSVVLPQAERGECDHAASPAVEPYRRSRAQ